MDFALQVPMTTGWNPRVPFRGNSPAAWIRPDRELVTTGGSREFNGTTQSLSHADNASLSTGDIDFTVVAWVKLSSLLATYYVVIDKWVTPSEYQIYYHSDATQRWRFAVSSDGIGEDGGVNAETAGPAVINTWYFICAWHDAANDKIYLSVNNLKPDVAAFAGGMTDTASDFRLGGYSAGVYHAGNISRAAFWKRILTEAERAYLWNSGQSQSYGDIGIVGTDGSALKTNLISWWNLNEASGNAIDQHGSNDLTDNGSVTAAAGVTTRMRSYASATNEYHSVADNADHSVAGDIDFFLSMWLYVESWVTGFQPFICKQDVAWNREFFFVRYSGDNKLMFGASPDGTNYDFTLTADNSILPGNLYYVLCYRSKADKKLYVRINDGASSVGGANTTVYNSTSSLTVGVSLADGLYNNGRLGRLVLGKPPTAIEGLIDDIQSHFYADGDANDHTQLTAAQRAAWGIVSNWDGDEVSGGLLDKIGARSRDFERTNSEYLSIADSASVRVGDYDFTFGVKFNAESWSDWQVVFSKDDGAVVREFILQHNNAGVLKWIVFDGTGAVWAAASSSWTPTTGSWVTCVVDFDASENLISIQINNGTIETESCTHVPGGAANPLVVGADGAAGNCFDGRMSSFVFFKRQWTTAERTAFYASGGAFTHEDAVAAGFDMTSLTGWWDLDEYSAGAAAVTAVDRSGNALNLTDNNTVASGPGPGPYPAYDMADNNTVTVATGPGTELGDVVDGDPVKQLISKEGSELVLAEDSSPPSWNAASANLHSHPSLSFDGVDDLLTYAASLTTASQGTLFIIVFWGGANAGADNGYAVSSSDTAGTTKYITFGADTSSNHVSEQINADTADNLSSAEAISETAAELWVWKSDDSTITFRRNGVTLALTENTGANNGDWFGESADRDNWVLGALTTTAEGNFFKGEVAEIVLYNVALEAAEIERAERYFMNWYKIG